ncbi:hypothetical protein F6455_01695 [Proteobacteria bacterium 005FR1]|nr:hypothetical protein [Proteobacteria bacterium 005FR1]
MQLSITHEERELLVQTLESNLSDLSYEIGNTDSFAFREDLKRKSAAMKSLLATLRQAKSEEERPLQ